MIITKNYMKNLLRKEYEALPDNILKKWLAQHLIAPTEIILFKDLSSQEKKSFWLVSDHNGIDDSSYRIVHSKQDVSNGFGLEMTTSTGDEKFMGFYGRLKETLENM